MSQVRSFNSVVCFGKASSFFGQLTNLSCTAGYSRRLLDLIAYIAEKDATA